MNELKITDSEMLLNMIISSPELEPAKKETARHLTEVKTLATDNIKLNTKVGRLAEDLETKQAHYNRLKEENEMLKAQEASIVGQMSKGKVISTVDKKINNADIESESLAKAFYKGTGKQTKEFLEEYLAKRRAFHKYQILKVVINR